MPVIMYSINSAAKKGFDKLRLPIWKNYHDHFKIDIIAGKPGPWGHLYSPTNEAIGEKNPQDFLLVGTCDLDDKIYTRYLPTKDYGSGPIPLAALTEAMKGEK